jgi:hypothetical protein
MEEKANNPMAESLCMLLVTTHMYLQVSIVYRIEKNVRVQGKGGIMIKLQISCSHPFIKRPNPVLEFLNNLLGLGTELE